MSSEGGNRSMGGNKIRNRLRNTNEWKRYEMIQRSKNDSKQQRLTEITVENEVAETDRMAERDKASGTDRFILGTEHNSTMQYNRTNSGYRNGRSYWRNRGYSGSRSSSGSGSGSGFRSDSGSDSRGAGNKNNDFLLTLGFSEGMGREYMLQNKVFYGRVNLYKRRETEKAYLTKIYAKPVNGSAVVAEAWVPKSIIAKRSAGWIMNKLNEVLSQPNAQNQPSAQSQPNTQSHKQGQIQPQVQSQPEALTLEEMVEEVVSQNQSQIKKQSQNKTQPNIQNKSQDQGKGSKTPANKKE